MFPINSSVKLTKYNNYTKKIKVILSVNMLSKILFMLAIQFQNYYHLVLLHESPLIQSFIMMNLIIAFFVQNQQKLHARKLMQLQ